MIFSKKFLLQQEQEIKKRLERYNNVETVKEQVAHIGDLTPYQRYKIETVSFFLREALKKIHDGTYGKCTVCGEKISEKRMKIVPGALRHVHCET